MKIPLSWLRDYIDLTLPPAQLIERLTLAGLEVAGTRVLGLPIPDGVRATIRRGASPAITLKVYAHLFRKDDGKAAGAINAALAGKGKA